MEKSTEIKNIAKALSKFQSEMTFVGYDASNPFFKSKYATLTKLVTEAREKLGQCGLSVSQLVEDECAVITILMHESGEWISSKVALKPVKQDPQGLGSAITYARRYAYASILGLVSDNDDDANHATFGHKDEAKIPSHSDRIIAEGVKKFGSVLKFNDWLKTQVEVNASNSEDLKKLQDLQLAVLEGKIINYKAHS